MTQLEAIDLTVHRAGRSILSGVHCRAVAGEFVAIVGPNGAGKSTLLSGLAGLLNSFSGTVRLDGHDLSSLPRSVLARRRSYLPQQAHCEWAIPVERLVALGLIPRLPAFGGLSTSDRERVERALSLCDLSDRSQQPATTLSGGELARAMLARALVCDPDILIVDEPISGLDPRHSLDCMRRFQLLANDGKLVIAAIHDLTLAARHASRVITLRKGKIHADGTPRDVLVPHRLREVFEVEVQINEGLGGQYIDFLNST